MKYVMFENELGHKLPVIFSDDMTHKLVAQAIVKMNEESLQLPVKPVSAGFVSLEAKCSGRSESLNMEPAEYDSVYIDYNDSLRAVPEHGIKPLLKELKEISNHE